MAHIRATVRRARRAKLIVALVAAIAIPRADAVEATGCTPSVAKVVGLQGQAEARKAGSTRWKAVRLEQTLCGGDMLRVLERSRATIWLPEEETTVQLDQRTVITLPKIAPPAPRWLELLTGAANFLSRTPRSFKITTPFLNAYIEGTEFLVRVRADETMILVFSGTVLAENSAGRVKLQSGQQALAKGSQPPQRSLVIRPRDAVEWALYYPPIIDYRSPALIVGVPELGEALRRYRQNDVRAALANLDDVPDERRDVRYFDLRAALLLSVGRVDKAKPDIAQALRLNPTDATAISLESIIALVRNDRQKALRLAQTAVQQDAQSSVSHIALSYAQQGAFDIEAARKSVQQAVRVAPDNGLAWARLAELELALGQRRRALSAAEKAVGLNPTLARTQTVLGFVALTQIKIKDAQRRFEQAIRLDPADPLPRLGLGLAKIRRGELDAGTEQIEIAASLDPNQSLTRSYLGKAYYEQKRNKLARDEFKNAKELDPKDPTPYFYDAIRKQTENLPVDALHDLEGAINRNDNRAVYRSRLLLDQDLAARSASLGRIYQELGFEQLGLVEAWKSVNAAPSNYSAHRFLAESYDVLPRHQTARASELLQAQLLQPINVSPIQPQLAETNLFIQEGVGPTDLALNEYNPLFNRDRYALMASAIVGSNGTFGDEVVHSGIHGRYSYSLGQFHYQTNGDRANNDSEDNLYNMFLQSSLSDSSNVQVELRYTEADEGDRGLGFFPEDFSPTLRQERESRTARLGFHHSFSNNSNLIGSFIYKDLTGRLQFSEGVQSDLLVEDALDESAYVLEGQYQLSSFALDIVSGGGHFKTIGRTQTFSLNGTGPIPFVFENKDTSDIQHSNVYAYSYINRWKSLTAILGVSANFFDGTLVERNQINPKFGLIWTPRPGTTLRAAAFRVLEPGLSTVQTIEPTQVAGFSQFLGTGGAEQDIENATRQGIDAWRFGLGASHRFAPTLNGGVELSTRKLRVQGSVDDAPVVERWREYIGRAYLYWAPDSWVSATLDYHFERLETGEFLLGAGTFIHELDTHRVPIRLNVFHPCGLSARIGATLIDQRGLFFFDVQDRVGTDRFWLLDASVRYRLPKRYGLVTFGVNNLLGEEFNYREIDPLTPTVSRDRFFFGKISLSF